MKKVFMLPIEPLDMRYSTQWAEWFENEMNADPRFNLCMVNPEPLTHGITSGAFLDVCGTNYYKARQLAVLSKLMHYGKIKDDDVIFLHDGWFPGVEMLAYMRDGMGIDFKIASCFHAGTYDPTDFISAKGMGKWGADLENSWFEIYDAIFVATQYHKDLICDNREIDPNKIHVTGFPIYVPQVEIPAKEKIVVFPHRLTPDKNPEKFDEMASILSLIYPDWKFIKTQELGLSKSDYYKLLAKCSIAVSCADHENWGIAMQEAIMLHVLPIVPDKLSYKEMYKWNLRYGSYRLMHKMVAAAIEWFTANPNSWDDDSLSNRDKIILDGKNAIPKMLEIINAL